MTLWRAWWSSGSVMIFYASLLHLAWAIVLMISGPAATGSTPLSSLSLATAGRHWGLVVVLIASALAALWGVAGSPSLGGFILMLPQQLLLLISAFGGLLAVVTGTYADGVVRPWAFILTDQLPIIIAAPLYTVAVFIYHGIAPRRTR